MKKRALVVGSPGHAAMRGRILKGVEHDTRAMQVMLVERGFEVRLLVGEAATRDAILAAYTELIEQFEARSPEQGPAVEGAAVFYYSGHGFHGFETGGSRTWQGIVPMDMHLTTEHDFRGIMSWEISIKQAQLTQRIRNVTAILDCCHSSQMSRDGAAHDAIPRSLPHPLRVGIDAHLAALRASYKEDFDVVALAGNPHAVRVVACGQDQVAFETRDAANTYYGVFTAALLEVLAEVGGAEPSWAAIDDAIRARVLRRFPAQRPDIEGPVRRRLFSLTEDDETGAVSISLGADGVRIGAGRIRGVLRGDRYGVMPLGSKAYGRKHAFAEVVIEKVSATFAEASTCEWKNGHTALPEAGAIALPIEKQATRRVVAVDAPVPAREVIEAAVTASPLLRLAGPGALPIATLRLADDQLTIEDAAGPLFPAGRFPDDLAGTVKNIANLAVAQAVRELVGEYGVYSHEVEIEWGALDRGGMRKMPEHGGALGLQDRIYLKLKNTANRQLYAHVFNIGLRGKISLLTGFAPTGVALRSGAPEVILGAQPDGTLVGFDLSWPPGLPTATFPRIDELVVIVTSAMTNLQSLVTVEHRAIMRNAGAKLGNLLAQLHDGGTRNVSAMGPADHFLVKSLSFFLHPRDARMVDSPFEVDENPLRQAGARAREAWLVPRDAPPPRTQEIAIRIGDLVVEQNRALGAADVRVDALVCTRSANEAGSRAAWTQKCARIRDGERLPLDNALVFHGEACDFVDICLWVSRDTAGSLELARLLAARATSPELKDAAGALLLGAGVAAAPWVTAVGASAVVARMAYELILGVAGMSIGLYRTSFLAGERFGIGRHPAEGLHRAQGFSFSLLVEPVRAATAPAGA